jgi:hypothetical protein
MIARLQGYDGKFSAPLAPPVDLNPLMQPCHMPRFAPAYASTACTHPTRSSRCCRFLHKYAFRICSRGQQEPESGLRPRPPASKPSFSRDKYHPALALFIRCHPPPPSSPSFFPGSRFKSRQLRIAALVVVLSLTNPPIVFKSHPDTPRRFPQRLQLRCCFCRRKIPDIRKRYVSDQAGKTS